MSSPSKLRLMWLYWIVKPNHCSCESDASREPLYLEVWSSTAKNLANPCRFQELSLLHKEFLTLLDDLLELVVSVVEQGSVSHWRESILSQNHMQEVQGYGCLASLQGDLYRLQHFCSGRSTKTTWTKMSRTPAEKSPSVATKGTNSGRSSSKVLSICCTSGRSSIMPCRLCISSALTGKNCVHKADFSWGSQNQVGGVFITPKSLTCARKRLHHISSGIYVMSDTILEL